MHLPSVSTFSMLVMLILSMTSAHLALLFPEPRGMVGQDQFDGEVHAFIGYNSKRTLPCNGYDKGPITTIKAGEVIKTRFWGPAMTEAQVKKQPDPKKGQVSQARHGGGMCEYSLSYDGGKTFARIAKYTQSCPDVMYEWPIKIPDNAPSCNNYGNCLLVWSWTAVNIAQYYRSCVDVVIEGAGKNRLDLPGIQTVDAPNYKQNVVSEGDKKDTMGAGPNQSEVDANLA